ncbi:MAG TPA: hypothetical protein EYN92_04800 [Dehalococcoidia bacterium]|nr:hypothetical protein [Dehalococcoidia bacterium]
MRVEQNIKKDISGISQLTPPPFSECPLVFDHFRPEGPKLAYAPLVFDHSENSEAYETSMRLMAEEVMPNLSDLTGDQLPMG